LEIVACAVAFHAAWEQCLEITSEETSEESWRTLLMSRIIVVPDSAHPQLDGCPVLMNEEVHPEHLQDGDSANQLIQRVAWAICDASDVELQAVSYRGPRAVRHRQ
jgi:hypothetical protein